MTTVLDFALQLIAAFLGVFGAFVLDDYREKRADDKEEKRVLGLIQREIDANLMMIETMLAVVQRVGATDPIAVPNARTMQTVWEGVVSGLGGVRDEKLLEQINLLYFEMDNLDRMLDTFRQHATDFLLAPETEKKRLESAIKSLQSFHQEYVTEVLRPHLEKVSDLIDSELGNFPAN